MISFGFVRISFLKFQAKISRQGFFNELLGEEGTESNEGGPTRRVPAVAVRCSTIPDETAAPIHAVRA